MEKCFGTLEWAEHNENIINGCLHNCKYCYSKEMAIRFKRRTDKNWHIEEIKKDFEDRKIKKINGLIMFPSAHDITEKFLDESILFIKKLLYKENSVLIVTKPHIKCITSICNEFSNYKERIIFRFTIGSNNNETLKFWEENAPLFEERLSCLKFAYNNGFQTSISCEPMLDNNILELISQIIDYVTNDIWIGKPNFLIRRLKMNGYKDKETFERANKLISSLSDDFIKDLYEKLKNNSKIKWKDSIKKVIKKDYTKQLKL